MNWPTAIRVSQVVAGLGLGFVAYAAAAWVRSFVYPDPAEHAYPQLLQLLVMLGFALTGFYLVLRARDERAALYGASLLLVAYSFAHRPLEIALLYAADAPSFGNWLLAAPLDILIPPVFWMFLSRFPRTYRYELDMIASVATHVAWVLAVLLLICNLLAVGFEFDNALLDTLSRRNDQGVYWLFVNGLIGLGAAFFVVKSLFAVKIERRRMALFCGAAAIGFIPILLVDLTGVLVPAFREYATSESGYYVIVVSQLMLLSVLLTTGYAVSVAKVLPMTLVARRTLHSLFSRIRSDQTRSWMQPDLLSIKQSVGGCARGALNPHQFVQRVSLLLKENMVSAEIALVRIDASAALEDADASIDQAVLSALVGRGVLQDSTSLTALPGSDLWNQCAPSEREWLLMRKLVALTPVLSPMGSLSGALLVRDLEPGRVFYDSQFELLDLVSEICTALDHNDASSSDRDRSLVLSSDCHSCGYVCWSEQTLCPHCQLAFARGSLPEDAQESYDLKRWLGTGSMANVYLAVDLATKAKVALKVPRRGSVASQLAVAAALQREARMMAQVSHPNLAKLNAIERWNGQSLLVIEHFECGTLADQIRQGSSSYRHVLNVGKAITKAVIYLHSRGLLHRDIKPANIGLSEQRIKLMDFGLTMLEPQIAAASDSYRIETPGTRAYMTPETLRGGMVSAADDVWAIAVTMYEALAGKLPFRLDTNGEPNHAEYSDPGIYSPTEADGLVLLLQQMLHCEPSKRRPTTAVQLSEHLERLSVACESVTQ